MRVKINEYVHAWSEFLFVSLLFIFNFFPKINQDVENHCAHLRDIELKTVRKMLYLHFPMYYNWIGEREITKLKQIFASNPEKRTQKQAQKGMNEMERHKMDYLIFSAMRMHKRHLFCTSSHHDISKTTRGHRGFKCVSLQERVCNC